MGIVLALMCVVASWFIWSSGFTTGRMVSDGTNRKFAIMLHGVTGGILLALIWKLATL